MRVLTGRNAARLSLVVATCVSAAALLNVPASAEPSVEQSSVRDNILQHAVKATRGLPQVGTSEQKFQSPIRTRVTGGTDANVAETPWVVGIDVIYASDDNNNGRIDTTYNSDGTIADTEWYESVCTGTVISPTKVLTAAHCTVDLPMGKIFVIAGRNDMFDQTSGGTVAEVRSVWTHQGFTVSNGAPVHDVSILTLRQPLPATYTPLPTSANGDQTPYAAGTEGMIIGYGRSGKGLGYLQKATVPMQSDAACAGAYGNAYNSTTMFCAGSPGVDTCPGDSGGPVVVDGKLVGITDWGAVPCGSSYGVYERISYYHTPIHQDVARAAAPNLDFSGDGHSELMVRDSSGYIYQYDSSGLQGTMSLPGATRVRMSSGFAKYTKIFRVYNWNGDHKPGIMARDAYGRLYLYQVNAFGYPTGPKLIGSGWNKFTDIMVTNNWIGNGRPNLMGRTAGGDLIIYNSNGSGGWENPYGTRIGSGWHTFNTVLTPGAWYGDGRQTLIGRTSTGTLRIYISNGKGGWVNPAGTLIGTGWSGLPTFLSPGDWDGDNKVDLIGRTTGGDLRLYTTNGKGGWLDGRGKVIGRGWNGFNAIF